MENPQSFNIKNAMFWVNGELARRYLWLRSEGSNIKGSYLQGYQGHNRSKVIPINEVRTSSPEP